MHEREDEFLTANMNRLGLAIATDGGYLRLVRCARRAPGGADRPAASKPARPDGQARPADRATATCIDVPGVALRAVWTPGHSPGHLCFYDETRDLLLTGDHVLPRITPNISSYDLTSTALADYLRRWRR